VGSVVGREFTYELIAGLEIMSEDSLVLALRMLTTSALLNCQGDIPHAAYAFSHQSATVKAYWRSSPLAKLRAMFEEWADFCTGRIKVPSVPVAAAAE
jgi:hypothetical protein